MRALYIALLVIISLSGCSKHDADYYRLHPKKLQEALKNCPSKAPAGMSCTELKTIAEHTSQLVYELQMNPQAFGLKIITLQQTLATESAKGPSDNSGIALKRDLQERLAIIQWLESPESM